MLASDLAEAGLDGGLGSKVEPGRETWSTALASESAEAGLDGLTEAVAESLRTLLLDLVDLAEIGSAMLLADGGLGTNGDVRGDALSMLVADLFAESLCTLFLEEVLAVTGSAMLSAEEGLVGGPGSKADIRQVAGSPLVAEGWCMFVLDAETGRDPCSELVAEAFAVG